MSPRLQNVTSRAKKEILSKSLVKGGLPRKKDAYGLHTISLLAWCRFQLHRAPVQRD